MNLKNILDKYTKASLVEAFLHLYPHQKTSISGYEYIIDELKDKVQEETDTILHIDMYMKDGKDSYEVYGLNQNKRIDLSFMPWNKWVTMEIDPEILEYIDEKVIFGHALYEISFNSCTEDMVHGLGIDISDVIETLLSNPNTKVTAVSSMEDLFKEMDKWKEELMNSFTIEELGTFELQSDELVLSDANCFDDKIILGNMKQGTWHASVVNCSASDEIENDYIELAIKHEDIKDVDIYDLYYTGPVDLHEDKLITDNKKIVVMDASKLDENKTFNIEDFEPCILESGVLAIAGVEEGPYEIYLFKDEEGKIVGLRIAFMQEEDDEY